MVLKTPSVGMVIWFTGLPGSGKTTLADEVNKRFKRGGYSTLRLDGDELRKGLCSDLDFSDKAREENLRRAAEVAKIVSNSGTIVLASFITPTQKNRDMIRMIIGDKDMVEIFCDASLETCIERDPKGMYRKAIMKVIPYFTGISAPYEPPTKPDIHLNTESRSIEDCTNKIFTELVVLKNNAI